MLQYATAGFTVSIRSDVAPSHFRIGDDTAGTRKTGPSRGWKRELGCSQQPKNKSPMHSASTPVQLPGQDLALGSGSGRLVNSGRFAVRKPWLYVT
jgi:hypothetical protein